MFVRSRVRRSWAGAGLCVLLMAGVLSGCQVAKAGAKCRTTDWGRDNSHILQCKSGRWRRVMTIRDYLFFLKAVQDAKNATTTTTTPPGPPAPTPVGPSPLSSWNLVGDVNVSNPDTADGVDDGVGRAAAVIGNTAYIGGSFSQISDGTTTLGRGNVAAFDISTGQPTGFIAHTNGRVTSLATDGAKLFIGGTFSIVNGETRDHFAAVDPTTGALVGGAWVKNFSDNVYTMAVSDSKLYVGGIFTNVGGTSRGRAAAINLGTGALDAFNPVVTGNTAGVGGVDAITAEADDSSVYIGGYYTTVGGSPSTLMSRLSSSGALVATTWQGLLEAPLDLDVASPGKVVAAIGGVGGDGDRMVAYDSASGSLIWTTGSHCNGDGQAILAAHGSVYGGFHKECGDDPTNHLLEMEATSGVLQPFKPVFDGYWGVFDIAASASSLVIAGQFDHVNGAAHKGFAIFSPAP